MQMLQKDEIKKYTNYQLVKDLAHFIKPYSGRFFVGSFVRLLADLVNLYPAYAISYVVDFFSGYDPGESLVKVWWVILFLTIAYVSRTTLIYIAKSLCFYVGERASLDAQIATVRHMISLDMSWHERENSGNKLKRIQNGGLGFDKIMRMWVNNIIEICVNFVGVILIMSKFDGRVSLLMAVFLIIYYASSRLLIKKAASASLAVNIKEESFNGLLFEAVNNIRTVKMMQISGSMLKIINQQIKDLFSAIRERIFRFQSRSGILHTLGYLFKVIGLMLAVYGITQGRYEVGFIALFVGYFDRVWESVRELSDVAQDLVVSRQSIARMKDILNEPIQIDSESGKKKFPQTWNKITIKNLSFAYGTNQVLKNISFEINRGEKVGIVGLSGAGKSTLFKLLLKEHEHYDGQILIDKIALKEISKRDYFNYISVVLQETEVFDFSLKDNITLVNEKQGANRKLLMQAMDVAHVTDFLNKLPQGVNTNIGEKGVRLSGGEKQRLGIARAIFKQPEILLLDEATSHLDLESEEKIRDSLHKFFEKVTAVVIAHRLTTIKEMDKIVVIEGGEIVEVGDFDQLYNKQGRFFELWKKQKL